MIRLAGINLDDNKKIDIALIAIYGIGRSLSAQVLRDTKIAPTTKVKDLTEAEEAKLRDMIEKRLTVEGDLRREVSTNIRRLKDVGSYRGQRHARKLPVHGQRTKTNARTKRGKRVTMGSGRKKTGDKT
ncbi:TPA: 30S ribosomal protein S13 [Patescibacteria group bacterium]|uniref:Small ribosomal subunit protein uS13 n=2 Tax=Bacteria division Kazan-3B-28 TaxID=1798534 RepID=A0A0G1ZFR9_UNCK3|nr:MAG: 30S ribosomal protein S13, small subunit ribosomal protein S13 [candidate division Kazan bacterium GW2011_GWA1_50_15]KKW25421.1 MAG: SSU ribosomal protein S13p (S18e) [candidate division Kazan bacterium GW2011_GWC1_52_13]KKW26727.1 MAG: SSU ribosomal protein S13p (S18e) [candidate division Kazan bacterium GW2011_GWB1_52_7]HAV65725.1 30S ribosomal protein S13 [Patescibacteria group bacterium]HCL47587.1 30S ribosomal protein S13 [Patescibacteria group bacterium]